MNGRTTLKSFFFMNESDKVTPSPAVSTPQALRLQGFASLFSISEDLNSFWKLHAIHYENYESYREN